MFGSVIVDGKACPRLGRQQGSHKCSAVQPAALATLVSVAGWLEPNRPRPSSNKPRLAVASVFLRIQLQSSGKSRLPLCRQIPAPKLHAAQSFQSSDVSFAANSSSSKRKASATRPCWKARIASLCLLMESRKYSAISSPHSSLIKTAIRSANDQTNIFAAKCFAC